MLGKKTSESVFSAIEKSPLGIASLDVLNSLGLCGSSTLKTILSRFNKKKRIIRLKRGFYSVNPMSDVFACAQTTFNGYLGFSTALYLHKLITEFPFTVIVVTTGVSKLKAFGEFEFKAVALREKAVGFERKGVYVVSTRAKTLFDCVYLPEYSVETPKLVEVFKQAKFSRSDWTEFDGYVEKFAGRNSKKFVEVKKKILEGVLEWT